jgi:SAM-dependent methyltransferase
MSSQSPHSASPASSSYAASIERFDAAPVAAQYPSAYGARWRERREAACLRRFLATVPRASRVLDLPCGTGRLTPLLAERDLLVVGADSSAKMVELAAANWERRKASYPPSVEARFEVRQGASTGYADGEFDAIVCNRLFHHFRESEVRVSVLREFGRICAGPILISYFDSFSLDALRFRLRHWWRGTQPDDRIPISFDTMARDVAAAGLTVVRSTSVLRGISPMCYLELRAASSVELRRAA